MTAENVEALYELSPMQQGLLFHTLYDPQSGVYIKQMDCVLQGDLDGAAFERAWQHVVDRHPILRTSFYWEELDSPLQVVHRQVRVPWEKHNWCELSPDEQDERLATFLRADYEKGFELSQAPLMRLALFRTAADTYHFVCSYHHLLLDGWSLPLIINEVLASYTAFVHGREAHLARPRPYQDYIAWLQQQDLARAEAFWRRTLAGVSAPTPFGVDRPPGQGSGTAIYAEQDFVLAAPITAALQALARQHALTMNTLVQGAWALLLSRYSGEMDVVFGATVSGRPPTLAGVETMVGLFINTLPVRVRVVPEAPLLDWLARLQAQQAELRQYEYSPLVQVQGWSAVPRGLPLFESIVVFENYPGDDTGPEQGERPGQSRLVMRSMRSVVEQTNYPLTLGVAPGTELVLKLSYDTCRFDATTIARMREHFQTLLEGIAAPARRLADLPLLTDAERHQLLVDWNATQTEFRSQESGVRSGRSDSRLLTPDSRCIHQLFEAQVARTPDAVAVVFDRPPTTDQRPTTNDHHRDKETRRQGDTAGGQGSNIGESQTQNSKLKTQNFSSNTQHPTPGTQCLTYGELNVRANQLAHYLRTLGVGPEVLVGLCVERSLELVFGLLGILKAGGAYVPLDPAYPQERLAFMLDDSFAPVLLTQERLVDTLPTSWSHLVRLDGDWPVIAQECSDNPFSIVQPDNLSYVIYTSGSTGTPKGVQVAHRGVGNLAAAQTRAFDVRPDSHVLQFASLSFDASVSEIVMALLSGATLYLPLADTVLLGPSLTRLLRDQGITTVTLPPSVLATLPAEEFPALRTLVSAGETCSADLVTRWAAGRRFCNAYGPTETTVCATIAICANGDRPPPIGRPIANTQVYLLDGQLQPVPVGVPGELYVGGAGLARGYLHRPDLTAERFIPNPFLKIEDRRLKIEDSGLAAHELLSSIFYPLSSESERLYKTGDRARYRVDGAIEYIGRTDAQVKVRGYRIELGEIEAVLGQHSAVREAVALAREDVPGDVRLVAYVVPIAEDRGLKIEDSMPSTAETLSSILYPLSSDLRAFLKEKLPDYMLPSAIVFLEVLPLTQNGKVDRKALPAPDSARPVLDTVFVAPRTPVEDLLATIWADVLGLQQVGVSDNFFALGGHSLLGTQVVARVRETFQVELPLRGLFEAPTVAALAAQITSARHDTPGMRPPPLRPVPRGPDLSHGALSSSKGDEGAALPLSFAQQRLWFLDQLQPGSAAYTIPTAVSLTGLLDAAALRQSLSAIVRRHEVLRTTFTMVEGQPVQVIGPARRGAVTAPLPLIDLQALPKEKREAAALWLAAEESQRPFDLAHGPLMRAALLRLDAAEHVVLLTMHHIVSDGWSVGVFIRELSALYVACTTGRPAALPELPIQYADFALWQRTWLQGTGNRGHADTQTRRHADTQTQPPTPNTQHPTPIQAQLAYWRQQLAGLPLLDLPTDHPRPPIATFRGALQEFVLPRELSAGLVALSRAESVTLFMTLLAAWQVLLARYSGQDDIAVGTDIANRTSAETEELIGFFVNQLVLRSDLSGNPPFQALLEQVREVSLDAYAHQDLPFEQLVAELQPERHLNRSPLFQVKIILQNAPIGVIDLPALALRTLAVEQRTTKFDLTLSMEEIGAELAGALEYSTDLFDAATIARMAGHLQTLLDGIVVAPECSIVDLPLLTRVERQQLLVDWNATRIEFRSQESGVRSDGADSWLLTPDSWCIDRLFEAQVARIPDAVAVIFDQRPTTNDQRPTSRRGSGQATNDQRSPLHPFTPSLNT